MNITERKRAEEVLRESEERFRFLFESSRDAFISLENKNRRANFDVQTRPLAWKSMKKLGGRGYPS